MSRGGAGSKPHRDWSDSILVGLLLMVVWWGGAFLAEWVTWRIGWSADASIYCAALGWFIGFPLVGILGWDRRHIRRQDREYKRAMRAWRASRPTSPDDASEWVARQPQPWDYRQERARGPSRR
jgi:hypothetical protein